MSWPRHRFVDATRPEADAPSHRSARRPLGSGRPGLPDVRRAAARCIRIARGSRRRSGCAALGRRRPPDRRAAPDVAAILLDDRLPAAPLRRSAPAAALPLSIRTDPASLQSTLMHIAVRRLGARDHRRRRGRPARAPPRHARSARLRRDRSAAAPTRPRSRRRELPRTVTGELARACGRRAVRVHPHRRHQESACRSQRDAAADRRRGIPRREPDRALPESDDAARAGAERAGGGADWRRRRGGASISCRTRIGGTRKLAIRNTGPGMTADELFRMCDLAASLGKEKGARPQLRHGRQGRVAPREPARLRYRSCKGGRVHEVRDRQARRRVWPRAAHRSAHVQADRCRRRHRRPRWRKRCRSITTGRRSSCSATARTRTRVAEPFDGEPEMAARLDRGGAVPALLPHPARRARSCCIPARIAAGRHAAVPPDRRARPRLRAIRGGRARRRRP